MVSIPRITVAMLAGCAVIGGMPSHAAAAEFKVLHSFCAKANCADGSGPRELFLDPSGDLYGVAAGGGANGAGVVYRLVRDPARDKWKYQSLYSFCAKTDCRDGSGPVGKLISDTGGNLYGTTYNPGTAFALKPDAERSKWTLKTLHRFCEGANCQQGFGLASGLAYQGAGAPYDGTSPLYGESLFGGSAEQGAVFSLTPSGDTWKYGKVHNFCTETQDCDTHDGALPSGGLLVDAGGNLFGASEGGGENFSGTIFELMPRGSGKWKEKILYTFCLDFSCKDGQAPMGIVRDAAGNFYGTTRAFGANGRGGTLFRLAADGSFSVLHDFCSDETCTDGRQPGAPPTLDATGNVYGTAVSGGEHDSGGGHGGVVFKRATDGTFEVLHAFCARANCSDGETPFAPVIVDGQGRLFGTTIAGGKFGGGTVFELLP